MPDCWVKVAGVVGERDAVRVEEQRMSCWRSFVGVTKLNAAAIVQWRAAAVRGDGLAVG